MFTDETTNTIPSTHTSLSNGTAVHHHHKHHHHKKAAARIISDLCTGCAICVKTCPTNCVTIVASELNYSGIAKVDERCTGCNICAIYCPWNGVEMQYVDGKIKEPAEYDHQMKRLRGYH